MSRIPGFVPPFLRKEPNNASADYLSRKITDVIRREISAEMLDTDNFSNAMWIAMQMLCGPQRAAMTIGRCMVTDRNVE
ncbi:hypothetical protein DO404_02280 [Salmonella enterica]|nr:hypothetical protein [Salmonella enterica]